MALDTIGSIALHIVESFSVPNGVSGNMVEIVDMARQHVENYTGQTIGSNSIGAKYQPAIINFAKADALDMINAQEGHGNLSLDDFSMGAGGEEMSAKQFRMLAENQLRAIGINVQHVKIT
jgi:hypothetical protein